MEHSHQQVYRKHRGSFKSCLIAIRAKCRFVFQIGHVYGFVFWHLIGTMWLMSSSTVLFYFCLFLSLILILSSLFFFLSFFFCISFFCLQSAIGRLLLQSRPAPHPNPSSQWRCRAAQSQLKTYTLTSRTAAVRPTASQDAATPLTASVASARAVWLRGPNLHQPLSPLQPLHPLQALYLLFQPLVTSLPPPLSPLPPLPHLPSPKMTPWASVSP